MANILNSLFCEVIILGVILKLGTILNLMKIQIWSKSKVSNNTKQVIINNVGIRQPTDLSGC